MYIMNIMHLCVCRFMSVNRDNVMHTIRNVPHKTVPLKHDILIKGEKCNAVPLFLADFSYDLFSNVISKILFLSALLSRV